MINCKIYDVISCLNNNLITHFEKGIIIIITYLEKGKRYDIVTLSIDRL